MSNFDVKIVEIGETASKNCIKTSSNIIILGKNVAGRHNFEKKKKKTSSDVNSKEFLTSFDISLELTSNDVFFFFSRNYDVRRRFFLRNQRPTMFWYIKRCFLKIKIGVAGHVIQFQIWNQLYKFIPTCDIIIYLKSLFTYKNHVFWNSVTIPCGSFFLETS